MRALANSLIVLAMLGLTACSRPAAKPPEPCRADLSDDAETAGRTVGQAAKTGVVAAADGAVQVGSATAGLVQNGTPGAKEKWKARGAETKQDARENANEVKREANRPSCR